MKRRVMWTIFAVVTIVLAAFNVFYDILKLNTVFPLTMTTNQHIYQTENAQDKTLPDAYLRELVRYRTVRVPYTVKTYDQYNVAATEEEREEKFRQAYYRENNYTRYFNEYSKECVFDDSLAKIDEVISLTEKNNKQAPEGFEELGIANDLLRYSFILNREHSKETAYFWYSWFYYSFAEEKEWYSKIWIMKDECEASKELTAVWDNRDNIYIMPKEYYEDVFASVIKEAADEH